MTTGRVRHFPRTPGQGDTVRLALDQALTGRTLVGLEVVVAEIARGTASLVDSARRAQDPRQFMAAADRLLRLTDRLDGKADQGDGDGGKRRGAGGGAAPGLTAELEDVLGSGPTLGDGEDPV